MQDNDLSPERLARLETISTLFSKERDDDVQARKDSGIEKLWLRCEEAYLGIDDANRSEFSAAQWAKPTNLSGPVTTNDGRARPSSKSTVFIRLTARYVDAGSAKLQEILLPADGKAFSFGPTPIAEMEKILEDNRAVLLDSGAPAERPMRPEEMGGQPLQPGQPAPTVPMTVADLAREKQEQAEERAKKAEKRIYDWMVEAQYTAQMRKVIFDMARIGVGVIKGPCPVVRRGKKFSVDEASGTGVLEMVEKLRPNYEWRDPWNIYPDKSCGENIQNGSHVWELDYLSEKQVREMIGQPGYLQAQLLKVLKDGPDKADKESSGQKPGQQNTTKGRYQVWYRHGSIDRNVLEQIFNPESEKDGLPDGESFHCILTMIGDTVVRAVFSPLESGELPYHACPWQRRAGHWAGVGVSEQIWEPQRVLNASVRALLNNAGKSSGSQIVLRQGVVQPADTDWTIFPDKVWYVVESAQLEDVRTAFSVFTIPNITPQMMQIIEFAYRTAEESTSIPLITQGQSGTTTPETFGATQLQNNNANQLLRSIGYAVDDYITEPLVRQSYEYLMMDPDVPDEEKGDWEINAHGSSSLVDRSIQDQTIAQMGNLVMNPAFGIDPEKWFEQFLRTKRLDPRDFQMDEAKKKELQSRQPPPPPAIAAAQIRAQSAEKIAQVREQGETQRAAIDTDRDRLFAQVQANRDANNHQAMIQELAMRRELALLDYANKRQISLEDAKVSLAQTTIKANLQRELAQRDQVMTPPTEPPGRAAPGHAYEQ